MLRLSNASTEAGDLLALIAPRAGKSPTGIRSVDALARDNPLFVGGQASRALRQSRLCAGVLIASALMTACSGVPRAADRDALKHGGLTDVESLPSARLDVTRSPDATSRVDVEQNGSCAPERAEREYAAAADVVFRGVAVGVGSELIASPATFQVEEYVKGTGPERLLVTTDYTIDPVSRDSVIRHPGFLPRPGQRWIIYANGPSAPDSVMSASICTGTTLVR